MDSDLLFESFPHLLDYLQLNVINVVTPRQNVKIGEEEEDLSSRSRTLTLGRPLSNIKRGPNKNANPSKLSIL